MPPCDGGEILRGACSERCEILRFAQDDTPPVIARLTKSAEAISGAPMRLPRFARNDRQNCVVIYALDYITRTTL